MKKLLIATSNKGKFREIIAGLTGLPFEFVSLDDMSIPHDFKIEEPAMTFEGNAIIKAMMYGNKIGLLTLAEDSGLEVDALDGRPGVYSARHISGTDEDRCGKVLEEMKNVPDKKRGAQYHAVVALYSPKSGEIRTCEGIYRGVIIREPRGMNNFGHDPIFYDKSFHKTCAEMTLEEKNSVSHRGMALKKAREILEQEFSA